MERATRLNRQERDVIRQGIRYAFTRDTGRLQQYDALLHKCYEEDLEVRLGTLPDGNPQAEEAVDHLRRHVIVASAGNYVIGGARLVISPRHAPLRLPLETEGFRLSKSLPAYLLDTSAYCELGRLAVLRDFRGKDVVKWIVYYAVALAQSFNCRYGFWIAPRIQAVYYTKILRAHGVKAMLHREVILPYRPLYKNIKSPIVLGSCHLTSPDMRHALLEFAPEMHPHREQQIAAGRAALGMSA